VNSRIFTGEIVHARLEPLRHTFRYPIFLYALDLDELPQLDRETFCFGHNRVNVAALHERDYLPGPAGTLKERVLAFLSDAELAAEIARVELVTAARYFNYVFNPVSFFYCYDGMEKIRAIIAEVHNTFGETHLYVLEDLVADPKTGLLREAQKKEFHVSPFQDMSGDYDFHCSDIRGQMDIRINIVRGGTGRFLTRLTGNSVPFSSSNLAKTLARYPVTTAMTMPRILWQAAKLHFEKGLPVYTKPNPSSAMTIGASAPTAFQRIAQNAVLSFFSRAKNGLLTIVMPDRTVVSFGTPGTQPEVRIHVLDHEFFTRCLLGGDIGFGEAYTEGNWETDDLPGVLAWFAANFDCMDDRSFRWAFLGRIANRFRHLTQRNTPDGGSKRNIAAHYDLSNEFFQLFLDDCMTYSGALFTSPDESLAQAQLNKIHAMISKANIGPDDHVLEIGCGWGGFAIEAVRTTGCRVTGITLSERQLEFARARVAQEGLSDRIDFQLIDFRHMTGKFDRIVSIEMLEAVGHENIPPYFAAVDRLLRPDGIAAIQVITVPDQRYESYRTGCDWIQKYIFPGAVCPSLTAITQAMTTSSRLVVERVDNIGYDYARTLREWRQRFHARQAEVLALGFDRRFIRMWDYYLSYCEAGFEGRILSNLQLVLTRPNNSSLPKYEVSGCQSPSFRK
jgi:cyclopropane-fatty-acyl-phospholipid synthase